MELEKLKFWVTKSSTYILDRWWLKIRQDHVILPSGQEIEEFHVLEYPDWTMMLATDETDRLLLVEQYRHGIGRLSLEFPSGMLEKGEEPLEGAMREFMEETGFEVTQVSSLGRLVEDPSRHNNTAFAFIGSGAKKVGSQNLDATEDIKLYRMTPMEVHTAILNGQMVHGLHIGTFYRAIALGYLELGSIATKPAEARLRS